MGEQRSTGWAKGEARGDGKGGSSIGECERGSTGRSGPGVGAGLKGSCRPDLGERSGFAGWMGGRGRGGSGRAGRDVPPPAGRVASAEEGGPEVSSEGAEKRFRTGAINWCWDGEVGWTEDSRGGDLGRAGDPGWEGWGSGAHDCDPRQWWEGSGPGRECSRPE